ncbi:Protein N-methyltransferase NNT1, partial [Smittium mucronatum]
MERIDSNSLFPLFFEGKMKITSTNQFLELFERLETEISKEQNVEIETMKTDIKYKASICHKTLQVSKLVLSSISNIQQSFEKSKQTELLFQNSIKDEKIVLKDKEDLQVGLSEGLQVFKALDEITRLFNSPGDNVCADEHFFPYLNKIGYCIQFLQNNRYARDAELYLSRFHQAQIRALTLIKMLFFQKLKSLLILKDDSKTLVSSNVLFTASAAELRPYISEVESRIIIIKEADSLLLSMYRHYFNTRRQIVCPFFSRDLEEINSALKKKLDEFDSNYEIIDADISENSNLGIGDKSKDVENSSASEGNTPDPLENNLVSKSDVAKIGDTLNELPAELDIEGYSTFHSSDLIKQLTKISENPPDSEKVDFQPFLIQAEVLYNWCAYTTELSSNEYFLLERFFDFKIFNRNRDQSFEHTKNKDGNSDLTNLAISVFSQEPDNYLYTQLSHGLVSFLESFLSLLYDMIRPLIISEHKIISLSSYCLVLRSFGWTSNKYGDIPQSDGLGLDSEFPNTQNAYSNLEFSNSTESRVSNESNADESSSLQLSLDLCMSTFYSIIDILLGDASHRLVFRSQTFIETYISNYQLTDTDFDDIKRWTDEIQKFYSENTDPPADINNSDNLFILPPPSSDPNSVDLIFSQFCGTLAENSHKKKKKRNSMDQDFGLDGVFNEPEGFFQKETPDHSTVYTMENGTAINLRIVGEHPLWGNYLWNASVVLAKYIERHAELVSGKTVLELGAAAGLPSLVSAALGAAQ